MVVRTNFVYFSECWTSGLFHDAFIRQWIYFMVRKDYYQAVTLLHRILEGLIKLSKNKKFAIQFIFGAKPLIEDGCRVYFDTVDRDTAEV